MTTSTLKTMVGQRRWISGIVFTVAAGVYQFAVLGIRLFFPVGFGALLGASLWFARTRRS